MCSRRVLGSRLRTLGTRVLLARSLRSISGTGRLIFIFIIYLDSRAHVNLWEKALLQVCNNLPYHAQAHFAQIWAFTCILARPGALIWMCASYFESTLERESAYSRIYFKTRQRVQVRSLIAEIYQKMLFQERFQ